MKASRTDSTINPSDINDRPLAIDLFAGLGGWTAGLLVEGYRVVGFDIERHSYGDARYPAQLVIQDVLMLHGAQFKDAALIVASPPCQEFSYMAMPWTKAKEKAAALRDGRDDPKRLTALFDACFRIQREACEAAGHRIPLVVENVCGAQKWVGRARWHYGSFYLWGDVPALMPIVRKRSDVMKVGDCGWRRDGHKPNVKYKGPSKSFNGGTKNDGGSWFNVAHNTTSGPARNPVNDAVKGENGGWFNDNKRNGKGETGYLSRSGSKSSARKAASAHIAKIPFVLARHIGRAWYPSQSYSGIA